MVASVITYCQCWEKGFPIKGSVIYKRLQELLNCFVEYFHLGIALRMYRRGFCMDDIQKLEELLREFVDNLLATWILAGIPNFENQSL